LFLSDQVPAVQAAKAAEIRAAAAEGDETNADKNFS
jgi:hypothetical protein